MLNAPFSLRVLMLSIAGFVGSILSASAQQSYTPDVLTFDGATTLSVAPDPAFNLSTNFTIEFWVAAGWVEELGYNPVIVSNAGAEGANYKIVLLNDANGLAVITGDTQWHTEYKFSDEKLHHVAIVGGEGEISIFVDGEIQANFEGAFATPPSASVTVGSDSGDNDLFIGAIGQLRIWKSPLSPTVLKTYAMADILAVEHGDHPNIYNLSAISAFGEGEIYTVAAVTPIPSTQGASQ